MSPSIYDEIEAEAAGKSVKKPRPAASVYDEIEAEAAAQKPAPKPAAVKQKPPPAAKPAPAPAPSRARARVPASATSPGKVQSDPFARPAGVSGGEYAASRARGDVFATRRKLDETEREIQRLQAIKKKAQEPGAAPGTNFDRLRSDLSARISLRSLLMQQIEEQGKPPRLFMDPAGVPQRYARAVRGQQEGAQADAERAFYRDTKPVDLINLREKKEPGIVGKVGGMVAGIAGADPQSEESQAILARRQQNKKASPPLRLLPEEMGQVRALKPFVDDFLNEARDHYQEIKDQGEEPLSVDRLRFHLEQKYARGKPLSPAQERALPGIVDGLKVRLNERSRGVIRAGARAAEVGIGILTGGLSIVPRAAVAAGAGAATQGVVDLLNPELTPEERLKSAALAGGLSAGAEYLTTAVKAARGAQAGSGLSPIEQRAARHGTASAAAPIPDAPLTPGATVTAKNNPAMGELQVEKVDPQGRVIVIRKSDGRRMTAPKSALEVQSPPGGAQPKPASTIYDEIEAEAAGRPIAQAPPVPTPAEPIPPRPTMPTEAPVSPIASPEVPAASNAPVVTPSKAAGAPPLVEGTPPLVEGTPPSSSTGRTTGLSNAAMQADEEAGVLTAPASGKGAKLGEALAAGKKLVDEDGTNPDNLLKELVDSQRPASNAETGALLYRRTQLEQQLNKAAADLDAAIAGGGDPKALQQAYLDAKGRLQEFADNTQVLKTRVSDAFRALQERAEVDTSSYAAVATETRRVKGRALTQAEDQQIRDLTSRIKEQEAKIAAAEAKNAEYEAARSFEAEARTTEVPIFRLASTAAGDVDVPGYRRLSASEADDLAAFKRALDSEEPGRASALVESWGEERYERFLRTMEDLDSRDLVDDVIRSRREWLDEQKSLLHDVMEQETAAAGKETFEDGRGLVLRIIGGHKDKYGNWGIEDDITDDQLERVYAVLNTPGRQTTRGGKVKMYQTGAGPMDLRDLIFDGRKIPGDVSNPELAATLAAKRAAKAAQVAEELTLSPEKAAKRTAARIKLAHEREAIHAEIESILKSASALNDAGKVVYDAARFAGAGGRLALNYAREGVITLDEAAERVIVDLAKRGITITREQIVSDIAGQKKTFTLSEGTQRVSALKREAAEQERILKQLTGEDVPTPAKGGKPPAVPTSQSTLDLRAKAAEQKVLQKEAAKLEAAAKKAADAEAAMQARIANIERQLRTQLDPVTPPQKKARTATEQQLHNLRRELDEVRRLKAELDGSKAPATKAEPLERVSPATQSLRAAVKLKRETAAAAQKAATQARNAAKRLGEVQAEIADYQGQLASGRYALPTPKGRTAPPEELANLRAQRDLLKREVQAQIQPDRTGWDKAKDVWNLPKSLRASIDFSAPGRQGWLLGVSPPGVKDQFWAAWSPTNAARLQGEILTRPNAPLYQRSGLYLSTGSGMGPGEEQFASRLFGSDVKPEHLTGVKKYAAKGAHQVGRPYRASERAYTAYLNRIRADTFDRMVDALGPKRSPEAVRAIAKFINTATGRGGTDSKEIQGLAQGLSHFLFAPRFAYSRGEYLVEGGRVAASAANPLIQGVTKGRVSGVHPYGGDAASTAAIRREYAKQAFRSAVVVGSVYALLKGAGLEPRIETDPTSSDFGKIRIGDTRIDFGAGTLQPAVLAARLGTGDYKTTTGRKINMQDGGFGDPTATDVIARFARSKASPSAGALLSAVEGKDYLGRPYGLKNLPADLAAPMSLQEIFEAAKAHRWDLGDTLGLLNIFGGSIQTHRETSGKGSD